MSNERADVGFAFSRISSKQLIEKAKSVKIPIDERLMALNALRLRDSVDHDAILRAVMRRKREEPRFQYKAIQALGSKVKSTSLLEGFLTNKDSNVVNSSLYTLGYKGDVDSLKKINRLKKVETSSPLFQAVHFAKTMISYRYRLNTNVLAKVTSSALENFHGVSTESIRVSKERLTRSVEMLKALDVHFKATELVPEGSIRLSCDSQTATFFFGDMVKEQSWLNKNCIVGSVVQEDYCPGGFFVKYHVLINQLEASNHYALHVITPKGQVVMGGSAVLKDGKLDFDVRSVKRPGSLPLLLRGWLLPDDLQTKVLEAKSATTIRKSSRIVLGASHRG